MGNVVVLGYGVRIHYDSSTMNMLDGEANAI